jgi:hypothetical protein
MTKRALSLTNLSPHSPLDWTILIAGAIIGGYALKTLVLDHAAKSQFANSSNSIYPVHDTDLGNSMNSFVPTARQKYSTIIDPHHHHHHPGFHPGMHHGGHGGHHHVGRSFPDYTDRSNALPNPWLEHQSPYDSFNIGANLSNVIDKCAYVQTYNGNSTGSP